MYYSKNNSLSVPKNYGGNVFRVTDESDRTYQKEQINSYSKTEEQEISAHENNRDELPQKSESSCISSLLSGISVEDILLLGLIFVIHEDNPNDPILFLLLMLLLAK